MTPSTNDPRAAAERLIKRQPAEVILKAAAILNGRKPRPGSARKGGRPPVATPCPKCGSTQESRTAAAHHCFWFGDTPRYELRPIAPKRAPLSPGMVALDRWIGHPTDDIQEMIEQYNAFSVAGAVVLDRKTALLAHPSWKWEWRRAPLYFFREVGDREKGVDSTTGKPYA